MKYTRLTKEQLEEMHEDFARFLATQQITSDEWIQLKKEKPEVAEEEIDIFSDLVWEKVLSNTNYLEKSEPQALYYFKCNTNQMLMIGIRLKNKTIDLSTIEGLQWVKKNSDSPDVELLRGKKDYRKERNIEIFELIQQGAVICDGTTFEDIINQLKD